MVRPTHLIAAAMVLIALAAPPAGAGERIVGPGYAFDLPDRFDTRAGPWEVVARATCETLVQGLPFRPANEPRMRFYSVPAENGTEAVLVACRFDLQQDDALTSVDDLSPARFRAAYEHAMDTLPGGRLERSSPERLGGYLPAIVSQFRYAHPTAGGRIVHSSLVVSDCTGLLLLLDAPESLQVEYAAYFAAIGDSVRMLKPAPGLVEQLRYPIYGLAGLLCVLLVVSVTMRVRRARARARAKALGLVQRLRVTGIDGATPAARDPGSDDADEPAPADDPGRDASREQADPALAKGGATAEPKPAPRAGLRATLAGEAWDAQPALEPAAIPLSGEPADGAESPAEEEDAAERRRTPKVKIQRNADYL